MGKVFWAVACLALAVVVCVQAMPDAKPNRAILVAGMEPQIALINKFASEESWTANCQGSSGEMTTLRLVPQLWAKSDSEANLYEKLRGVTVVNHQVSGEEAEAERCDIEPQTSDGEHPTGNALMAVGTAEDLLPILRIARSCGFKEAAISRISEYDIEKSSEASFDIPAGSLGLYLGPKSTDRIGAAGCVSQLTLRMEADEKVN